MASTSRGPRRRRRALLLSAAAFGVGLAAAAAAAQDGAASDRAALEALYVLTGGPGWTDRTNWRTAAPLGEWHGVSVDFAGRVTSLDLRGNGLTGPLPDALGDLALLQTLNLGSRWDPASEQWVENALTGPIPRALGRLSNLESLFLRDNALTGPLPGALVSLSNLRWLDLWGNALTGAIPAWLGGLTRLDGLNLGFNDLTGPIPAELGSLSNLRSLNLRGNALTGPVPAWLGGLTRLERLDLGSNDLTGPIPAELGSLASLRSLTLYLNPLTGALPQSLTQLSQLTWLDILDTAACAPADAGFQAWLATIDFVGDTCTRPPEPVGTIPPQALAASGPALGVSMETWFSDPDDDALTYAAASSHEGAVTAIASGDAVWLVPGAAGTATVTVTARDPGGLSAEQTLAVTVAPSAGRQSDREVLEVFYDATGGPGWTNRGNWKTSAPLGEWYGVATDAAGRVTELRLEDNSLTGPIPAGLGDLARLESLSLVRNDLVGPIPVELSRLASLANLSLVDAEVTGRVPAWLGNLTRLRNLSLAGSALTGSIPVVPGNLVNLQSLSLGGNALTGSIPAALGNLVNLQSLSLGGNALTGSIPAALGNLTRLRWLSLGWNDLTGPIAGALGDLANLERANLSYNWGLSGPLPPAGRFPRLESMDILVTQACAPAGWRDGAAAIELDGRPCETGADVTVDVAVFHTPAAREEAGGAAAIAAVIDLMVAETNQAYAASGVHHRLRLVERSEVAYNETGNSGVDLRRFADPSDGHMDEVHAVRDRVGADLVHLIAEVDDVCGRAFLPGSFGLTSHRCGGRTFAHELGHNMGLSHDRYRVHHNEGGARPHPAYGYVNPPALGAGALPSRRWRTIMAYPTQCIDAYTRCSTPLRFSNPRQLYNGDPLGAPSGAGGSGATGPADAAAVLDATGPVVALWRDRPSGANRPPAAGGGLPDRTLTLPGTVTVDVSRAFVDPDGDLLAYAVSSSAPDVVTVLPAGARVTLTAVGEGAATVRVTATDPGGLSAAQSFTVTVGRANGPPEAVGRLPDVRLPEPGATLDVDASRAFVDPDGDALAYASSSSAPQVVTVLAAGSRVTLTAAGEGAATVRVTATDPGGLSAAQSFTVTVGRANGPPEAVGRLPDVRLPEPGATLDVDVSRTFVDPDGDALAYASSSSAPQVVTARAAGARVTLTAAALGRAVIEVTATDPDGQSAVQSFAVRVTAPFTDHPIRPGATPVRAVHFTELRARIDVLRREAGLAVPLDGRDAAGGGDTGPARASARAAGGAGRGLRGGGPGGPALDRPGPGGGDDPDTGGAPDRAARRGAGAGVTPGRPVPRRGPAVPGALSGGGGAGPPGLRRRAEQVAVEGVEPAVEGVEARVQGGGVGAGPRVQLRDALADGRVGRLVVLFRRLGPPVHRLERRDRRPGLDRRHQGAVGMAIAALGVAAFIEPMTWRAGRSAGLRRLRSGRRRPARRPAPAPSPARRIER